MNKDSVNTKADHFCEVQERDAGLIANALSSVSAHNVSEMKHVHNKILLKT